MHFRPRPSFACPHSRNARCASTSTSSFPYPTHPRPTPHQIFHLQPGATQNQIKARYYELVRIYHPDAPFGRDLSPAIRRSRFQSITAAYDALRGKTSLAHWHQPVDPYRAELERRRRARAAYDASRRRSEHAQQEDQARAQAWAATTNQTWPDRIILFVGILALGAGLGPLMVWPSYSASHQAHLTAAQNLAQARKEAREFGEERRREIRRRVEEYNALKAAQEKPPEDEQRS
ncbi:hypothetical protein BD413DRAFT_574079 [Trametes elegans]|nr:hypothetical protein BD413DRAFT_574079 [Trametes elegans]